MYMFQFQTGAIKSANDEAVALSHQRRFNSKLVRLKEEIVVVIALDTKGFQFQTGAIKSDFGDFYWAEGVIVSIPNWFD